MMVEQRLMMMMVMLRWKIIVILTALALITPPVSSKSGWLGRNVALPAHRISLPNPIQIRGGDSADSDEERYSRQVYTLGARAHGLVRSSIIYLDGPPKSGLLYECAKNLALSGVGNLVLLTSNEEEDQAYHVDSLDDLGQSYGRAARTEIGNDVEDDTELLLEFIKRLNPSVSVSIKSRDELAAGEGNQVLLSVDRPQKTQLSLNNMCRNHQIAFVAVETAGVYGRAFCDFGSSFQVFDADGESPLVVPFHRMEEAEGTVDDSLLVVHCIEGERHDVSKGDLVQFQLGSGEALLPGCIVEKVLSPQRFTVRYPPTSDLIKSDFVKKVNENAVSLSRVKVPQSVDFLSMEEALSRATEDQSLFATCDLDKSFDSVRRSALLTCFQTLPQFISEHKRFPRAKDRSEFRDIAKALAAKNIDHNRSESGWKTILGSFVKCAAGKLAPIQAILGAIGAQEALKAVSGLYSPIKQFLLYDCDELLDNHTMDKRKGDLQVCSGQNYILGRELSNKLANSNLFIVGAGAIGCELLKNLATMGAAVGKGRIIVTDMDTIEKSNLSRQLLFRDGDIGKFKSTAAHDAVLRFNPNVQMEIHTSKVGDEEHGHFDDRFWANDIEIILNALDNMEARLYMDGQCVANNKALVDAGTLGSKGNVQVVIPQQSESYGSSVDPPEPAIPVCTLKNFPYAISHTIQWGRDLFEGYFERRPQQANSYGRQVLSNGAAHVASKMIHELGEEAALQAALELKDDLQIDTSDMKPEDLRRFAITWAVREAKELFHSKMLDMLQEHPADSLDEDGEPFWSGTRRVPTALQYSVEAADSHQEKVNKNLLEFVKSAARLRIETLDPSSTDDQSSPVSDKDVIAALSRQECSSTDQKQGLEGESVESCLGGVQAATAYYEIEFEKDDDSNGHVAFVTAASNLRALCFGIPPVDAMETRRVAGRIVPAMITTTAFVSALSCIELIKLMQGAKLRNHRNAFINLALPFFAFTSPLPAEEIPGLRGTTYTQWDRIVIKEGRKAAEKGGISLKSFLSRVLKKAAGEDVGNSISIASVSFGPYMVYANFLHEGDKALLKQPLWRVIEEAIEAGDDDEFAGRETESDSMSAVRAVADLRQKTFVDLTVVVEDFENEEEVELPPVRVQRRP